MHIRDYEKQIKYVLYITIKLCYLSFKVIIIVSF